ncbi:hypothetical protein G6O67_004103 [Ophiocordyceps sinensis]|uniref:Uncharacterized protein n=1 Tax=Ophiocordyceps sinensis TaxID=72228 RepID=A0A8H4PNW3_9HYPO|nr:hypothetical protein G6O67_004103 [Ophiocordyceps sinensis]
MVTACLAIVLSAPVIWADFRGKDSTIRLKLLNGYSDSQILQGIGVQSVVLAKMSTLFLMFVNLALSSVSGVYLALSSVSGVYLALSSVSGLEDDTLPIAGVWQVDGSGAPSNICLKLNDQEEKTRGFVQLVSMLLLLFTVSVVEIHRGEIELNPRLGHSFQPNPFFGSQTNLKQGDGRSGNRI